MASSASTSASPLWKRDLLWLLADIINAAPVQDLQQTYWHLCSVKCSGAMVKTLLCLTPVYPAGRIRSRWGCMCEMLAVFSFLHSSRITWKTEKLKAPSSGRQYGCTTLLKESHFCDLSVTRRSPWPSAEEAVCLVASDWAGLGLLPSPGSQTHRAFHNRGRLSAEPRATSQRKAVAEEESATLKTTTAGRYLHKHAKSLLMVHLVYTDFSHYLSIV